jgi:hypothetical protein
MEVSIEKPSGEGRLKLKRREREKERERKFIESVVCISHQHKNKKHSFVVILLRMFKRFPVLF